MDGIVIPLREGVLHALVERSARASFWLCNEAVPSLLRVGGAEKPRITLAFRCCQYYQLICKVIYKRICKVTEMPVKMTLQITLQMKCARIVLCQIPQNWSDIRV